VVPTVQARGATYAIGTPGHSWQLTAQGKLPAAHKGLAHVAKVMAGTAIEVIQDEVLLARAKADHEARVSRNPYARCRTTWSLQSRCRRKPCRRGLQTDLGPEYGLGQPACKRRTGIGGIHAAAHPLPVLQISRKDRFPLLM
jgi:hypothetical protein